MFGGAKSVVGLDVGSHTVKAVALQSNRDRITLQGYAQAKIGTQDPATVVRQVIEQLGVKPRRLVTSVSGRSVIVRQVETPKLAGDELKAHITYEADKYIPFATDEVVIDCQPLPDRAGAKDNTQQVLLVAVRRGFVNDHLTMLRSAGLQPEVVDVDVFALSNAYELLGPGDPGEDKGAVALIDIGASKSNISIVHGSRLLFTREVYLAGNEITDAISRTFNEQSEEIERLKAAPGEAREALLDAAMPAFEDLANEIRLSFDYVEGQFEKQVDSVVLTGGSSQLHSISDILGNILSRPVHVFDPLAGMDLVPSKYDIHGLDANAPSLTIALGLAAHLLDHGSTGLGGQHSHGWQPRADGAAVSRPSAPAIADNDPTETAEVPPPQREPSGANSTLPFAAPPAMTAPPPVTSYTPVPPPPTQVAPMTAPLTNPMQIQPPDDDRGALPRGSTEIFQGESNKSGLLVILDDDQEIPPAPDPSTSGSRRKPTIKLESFEDEPDGGGLPPLPKI